MTTYCAPCITELALVREAVTAVSGTASCMAHAILLTHPNDDPGRRRQRLGQLRDLAAVKAETASQEEQASLELLVHEYGLANAMDMGSARRRPDDGPRRQGDGRPGDGRQGEGRPGEEGSRRPGKSRRGRPRPGERPEGERHGPRPEGRPGGTSPAGEGEAPSQAASNGDDPAPVMPAEGSGSGSAEGAGLPPSAPSAPEPVPTGAPEPGPAVSPAPAPAAEPSAAPAEQVHAEPPTSPAPVSEPAQPAGETSASSSTPAQP